MPQSLPPNPYSVLGISKHAAHSEIKKAYHKHMANIVKKLGEAQDAYELLTDEGRLAEYKRRAQRGAPRSGAFQPSASTYETASGTEYQSSTRYQYSARYQPPAGKEPPEWRTLLGLRTFYERCEVCGETDCREMHRWFTREGFVWEQLKNLHLAEPSIDAIVAARGRAGKEFSESISGMAGPSRDPRNINDDGYDRPSYGTRYG